jgi:uncharacterized protein YndB with AHSA1/START domain
MDSSLPQIVEDRISIAAPTRVVWEVLTWPRYIKLWEDIPADWSDDSELQLHRSIAWRNEQGLEYIRGTVIAIEADKLLSIALRDMTWKNPPADPAAFAYTYTLIADGAGTTLVFRLGDFRNIPDGDKHFQDAQRFEGGELRKIKHLAESGLS